MGGQCRAQVVQEGKHVGGESDAEDVRAPPTSIVWMPLDELRLDMRLVPRRPYEG